MNLNAENASSLIEGAFLSMASLVSTPRYEVHPQSVRIALLFY